MLDDNVKVNRYGDYCDFEFSTQLGVEGRLLRWTVGTTRSGERVQLDLHAGGLKLTTYFDTNQLTRILGAFSAAAYVQWPDNQQG